MRFTISFHAVGNRYNPSRVPFAFATQHDVGDLARLGRYKGQVYPYGSSEVKVPDDLPWGEKIPALVEVVRPLLPLMRAEGADDFRVSAGYFHDSQCNLEFTPEELKLLASLDCVFLLSCYPVDREPNHFPEPAPGAVH